MAKIPDRVVVGAARCTSRQIAKIAFTSEDRVREVIHNFNDDGFDSLASEVLRWPTTDVHAAAAPRDQEDRLVAAR